jgi:MYXO-CTERM domain-containing protein
MRTIISVGALLVAAGAANAGIIGFAWRSVDNSAATTGLNGWAAGNKTFDLYCLGSIGDLINGISAGGDGNANYGINVVGGSVYNTPVFGNNTRSAALETVPGFFEIRFDTYACYGGALAAGGPDGQATSFAGAIDLVGADGRINFSSFTQPAAALTLDPASPGNGSIRVLRITVSASTTHLGGSLGDLADSKIQVGLPGGVVQDFNVPDAIPAPGAAALLGLAGLAVARRRR